MKVFLSVAIAFLTVCAAAEPPCDPGVEFYPDPTNCNMYYQCADGVPVHQQCPPDLHWNAQINACDFPNAAGCVLSSTPEPTTTEATTPDETSTEPSSTTSQSTSTTSQSTSTTSQTTSTTPQSTSTTPQTNNSTTPSGPPTESTTSSGPPTESTTSSGPPTESTTSSGPPTESTTLSSIPTEDPITSSTPSTTSSTPSTTSQEPSTESPGGLPESCPPVEDPDHVVRLPHETNCEFYYRCTAGVPVLYSCPTSDDHFSPTLRKCQKANEAGCDSCPIVDVPGNVARLPHETDCHRYYLCQAGDAFLYQCREGWEFSRNQRDCLEPSQAKCSLPQP